MRARVTLTPEMLDRLEQNKTLEFRIDPGVTMLEVVLEEDDFASFDRTFSKLWRRGLNRLDKLLG